MSIQNKQWKIKKLKNKKKQKRCLIIMKRKRNLKCILIKLIQFKVFVLYNNLLF